MIRRHRNVLVKFCVAVPIIYIVFCYIRPAQNSEALEQSQSEHVDGDVEGKLPKIKEDKDIVIDVPDVKGPKRDFNIDQPELKELIEEKIVKEENIDENGPSDIKKDDALIEEQKAMDIPDPNNAKEEVEKTTARKDLGKKLEEEIEKKKAEEQPNLPPPMVSSLLSLLSTLLQPPSGPGEMGEAVKIEKPDAETKKKIDKGWKDNAFNGYVTPLQYALLQVCQ